MIYEIEPLQLSCGYNGAGQLGHSKVESGGLGFILEKNPVYISRLLPINLNGKAVQIACGNEHTVILMEDGAVLSCGSNEYGQLGHSKAGVIKNKSCLLPIIFKGRAKQVACGEEHTIILMEDGTVLGFGNNIRGQLGYDIVKIKGSILLRQISFEDRGRAKQVACGWSHTIILMEDGNVLSCGSNVSGQLCYKPEIMTAHDRYPIKRCYSFKDILKKALF